MSAEAPGLLLDITRLAARIGRGPLTGIDRVERAYLARFQQDQGLFLLIGVGRAQTILSGDVAPQLLAWIEDPDSLPPAPLALRLARRTHARDRLRAALAPYTRALVRTRGLAEAVTRLMPRGGRYFNTGHMNLDRRALAAIRAAGVSVEVLLHDTIPLDHPEWSGPGASEAFATAFDATLAHADRIICNSNATVGDVVRCAAGRRVPPRIVAPLGTDPVRETEVPAALRARLTRPYVLTVGTIEPRKDHALLLDVWDRLADPPLLVIAGRRGWLSEAVFARLDRLARDGGGAVIEAAGLDDGALAALMSGARALLMPSRAEGYGLPVAEAAAAGVPVLCCDLPVYREFAGDYPVYLPPGDLYRWATKITELAGKTEAEPRRGGIAVPTWDGHFHIVLRAT